MRKISKINPIYNTLPSLTQRLVLWGNFLHPRINQIYVAVKQFQSKSTSFQKQIVELPR